MQTQNERLSLINGRIHTLSSTASSITFEHGRIVSIDDETASINGHVIDLHGRTVLPAFCDTGLDFLVWAENQERLSLSGVSSEKAFSGALKAYTQANTKPLRGWYIAQGLSGSVHITRDDIDAVIPSTPCAVIDADNTHAVLNTPAMSAVNMPQDNTELEGFLEHLPPLSKDDILYLVRVYSAKINALGLSEVWTNFYDNNARMWDIFAGEAYDLLSFRVRANFGFGDVITMNEFLASGLRTGDGLPMCKMGGLLVNESLDQQEQKHIITSAHLSGCQLITGNDLYAVGIVEQVIRKFRKYPRHLISSDSFTSKLIDRMRRLNLGGISLPGGEDNDLHASFQNGIVISAGSGQAMISPLKGIARLVSEGLSVAEAVSVYTWSAAWNGGTDMRRGELALGNDADVVVLEQDPYLVKPAEIEGIDVTMTFCAGSMVYDSGTI